MYIDYKTAIDLGFRCIDVEMCYDALLKQYNNPKESAYEISYDEIMQIDK